MAVDENIPKMAALRVRNRLLEAISEFIREAQMSGSDVGFEVRESASGTPRLEITSHNADLILTIEGEPPYE